MDQFRRLMQVVLLSGAIAGLVLFVVQHFLIGPLIQQAETYEEAANQSTPGMTHEDEGWQPANGFERTAYTAVSTVLTAIGFASILFGIASFSGSSLDAKRGLAWGLAGLACFTLAPALGQPPLPPGAPVADLQARQIWWIGTAAATAIGLWLLTNRNRPWLIRSSGIVFLLIPHFIAAPSTTEASVVPSALIHQFAIASVSTDALFWILLGSIGGFLYGRAESN